ncbi:hypothetical protein HD554DRAFT_2207230 [Boletus coccyginus]|nr:hypothetical protein HD554DRAFT_2207230 [Boletus coccyginus]
MSNANLPYEMMEKEFCVRFMTGSPHAAPMNKAVGSGIVVWDCKENKEVMLIPYTLYFSGDNPMQADMCSHVGFCCNYFCRTCDVRDIKAHKEMEAGYGAIFTTTAIMICNHFHTVMHLSGATDKIKNLTSTTGITGMYPRPEEEVQATLGKELKDYLKGYPLECTINPLLELQGTDIYHNTPTEILHTILLGIVKYFWGQMTFLLCKSKLLDLFQIHLESIDQEGLNVPSLRAEYIVYYKRSLIGRHLKSLTQVMPYIIHDLVPKAILDLVMLLWHTKIHNIDAYLLNEGIRQSSLKPSMTSSISLLNMC